MKRLNPEQSKKLLSTLTPVELMYLWKLQVEGPMSKLNFLSILGPAQFRRFCMLGLLVEYTDSITNLSVYSVTEDLPLDKLDGMVHNDTKSVERRLAVQNEAKQKKLLAEATKQKKKLLEVKKA